MTRLIASVLAAIIQMESANVIRAWVARWEVHWQTRVPYWAKVVLALAGIAAYAWGTAELIWVSGA